MASSSDWMTVLQDASPPKESAEAKGSSAWIEALLGQGDFVEGLPMARQSGNPAPAFDQPETQNAAPPPRDPVAEAFARGEAAGRSAMKADLDDAQERQRALRLTFRNFDQAAMDSLAAELAETVIALCGQTLRNYVPDAENLQARCEAAAKRLGAGAQDCALHLNPHDIALLGPAMLENWRVVGDDDVARGGLKFEGPNGSISDRPSDWHRAISAAIRG